MQKRGVRSGTTWTLEATALTKTGFYIVECRRYTTSKIKQEGVGAIVYRAMDVQAEGAIVISPLGLQEGAKLVADAESVREVKLSANATPEQYVVTFHSGGGLGIRAADVLRPPQDQLVCATLVHADGTVEALDISNTD